MKLPNATSHTSCGTSFELISFIVIYNWRTQFCFQQVNLFKYGKNNTFAKCIHNDTHESGLRRMLCADMCKCLFSYTPLQRGNYHHSMFRNPTAAVNLFHVGKQYLTFCKAEAAVTHNLIGRKITFNVKHADARNSLPILDVIRSSNKHHSASKYCKWTLRQTTGVCYTRIYVLGAPSHFPTEYRHEAAGQSGT